jgi:hypothetical protein
MGTDETEFQNRWHGPCNFPVRVEIVNQTIRYRNNDPDSKDFGAEIQACPGCGEQFFRYSSDGQSGLDFEHWNLVEKPQAK